MIWGKTQTSRLAIAAAATVLATNAMAADLGGNCCADLEERVAELEATTARKGNRRVKLTVSGHVNETLLWWDDGEEKNTYVVTNVNSRTRFRFVGDAKISADWSAGYLLEIGVRTAGSDLVNQFADDTTTTNGALDLRHSAWWVENSKYGRLWVGLTSQATDGITEINLSNVPGQLGGPDMSNFANSFFLRSSRGNLLAEQSVTSFPGIASIRGLTWGNIAPSTGDAWNAGDGYRRNLVKYVSPTFWGFNASWSWGEDDFWDAALRYAGEFSSFRVAAGVGYQQWTDGDATQVLPGAFFAPGNTFVNTNSQQNMPCADLDFARFGAFDNRVRNQDLSCDSVGLSASVMHVPTGLFVAGSWGRVTDYKRNDLFADHIADVAPELVGTNAFRRFVSNGDDQDEHWFIQGGIEKNWFGLGKTSLFADYGHYKQGIGLSGGNVNDFAFLLTPAAGFQNPASALITNSSVDVWGVGIVQSIDAAAMDLYLGFRNFSGDADILVIDRTVPTVDGTPTRFRKDKLDLQDFQAVMAGGIIRF